MNIKTPTLPILVVDDERHALESTERTLVAAGYNNILLCNQPERVAEILAQQEVCAILLDLSMPNVSGEAILAFTAADYPEVPVIIVTGANELETAVRCMKNGASDYMVKPVETNRLTSGVRRVIELRELQRENDTLRESMLSNVVRCPEAFSRIVTNNGGMHSVFRYCESIAGTLWPALITGETGVGKELLAQAIHALSGRPGSFVAVNAAGLEDNVFSDTLFGHVRGAYTGADEPRKGLIERAAGGTLFLDEIADLTQASQVKLLRVLQEREYYPLGSDVAKRTDARLIFATNQDLDVLQRDGRFRKDLYHRLKTHQVCIPPLRKRLDDIPLLVDHFLARAAEDLNKKKPTPPRELYALLAAYSFPGNVRELEGMVYDAVAKHQSRMLSMSVFEARLAAEQLSAATSTQARGASPYALFDQLPTLKQSEEMLIGEAMRRAEHNQTIASRLLGISRTALNKRLNQSG